MNDSFVTLAYRILHYFLFQSDPGFLFWPYIWIAILGLVITEILICFKYIRKLQILAHNTYTCSFEYFDPQIELFFAFAATK